MTRTCDVCGSEFEAMTSGKRCSPECRRTALRAYMAAYKRERRMIAAAAPSPAAQAVAASVPDEEYETPLPKVKRLEVDGRLYECDQLGKPHLMGFYKGYHFPVRQALIDALEGRR